LANPETIDRASDRAGDDEAPRGRFLRWVDDRTGYRAALREALEEPIPGGARWRYVFGSALTAAFAIQLVTGLLLMATYSPSATTAWGSVYYITYQMQLGWFLRGIHHFGSQAMIVLLALHLIQVLLAGAYRAPREFNWWFGMVLFLLTVGLSLTGYLLPWDQKGYWATKVATNIAGGAPGLGPYIQRIIVGGADYGNQTLTRFYALHVGILPLLLIGVLVIHVLLFRRHGVTHPEPTGGVVEPFWPRQVFYDTVASAIVLLVIVGLVYYEGGANLDAPADPSSSDYPARPEWYFLSLFQLLKYFPGKLEIVGTVIVPSAILLVLFLMPLFDKILPTKLAHFLACSLVFALCGGVAYLTVQAVTEDRNNLRFQRDRQISDQARQRALFLAGPHGTGIAPEGAGYLLRRDPLYHGRQVLEARCLSCHYHGGQGQENLVEQNGRMISEISEQTASDLKGFGTREWVRGLLEDPASKTYFGTNPQLKGMKTWKKQSKLDAAQLDQVAGFVAELAKVPPGESFEGWYATAYEGKLSEHPGAKLFVEECGQCHVIGEPGIITEGGLMEAPNLFAYGSKEWIKRMIHDPGAEDLYGYLDEKDRMPAFRERLTDNDLETLVRFIQGDYLVPEPTAAGPAQGVGRH
jgi:ubiquinol-cytochrome c reductase cytochrome b subunit